jgi:hypothetical protein
VIEQNACMRTLDLPSPRVREIERTADLASASMRHIEESPWIAAIPATAFGEVEHDAARCALDLVSSVRTMPSKLHHDGPQRPNQVQRNIIGNQLVHVVLLSLKRNAFGPFLGGRATPVATDPRQDP